MIDYEKFPLPMIGSIQAICKYQEDMHYENGVIVNLIINDKIYDVVIASCYNIQMNTSNPYEQEASAVVDVLPVIDNVVSEKGIRIKLVYNSISTSFNYMTDVYKPQVTYTFATLSVERNDSDISIIPTDIKILTIPYDTAPYNATDTCAPSFIEWAIENDKQIGPAKLKYSDKMPIHQRIPLKVKPVKVSKA